MFFKIDVLKNFVIFTRKHMCWSLFLVKMQPTTLLKRDSNTGVFLWILEIFETSLFYRTPSVAVSASLKVIFCKASHISQETFVMESLFRKALNPHTCNCTKNDAITDVFEWIYLFEYICSFFHFNQTLSFWFKFKLVKAYIYCFYDFIL